jgi:predicted RNA-binding protein with PIN domain
MALHYILDGYNIVHKIPSFRRSSAQESRDRLIRYLQTRRPQGSIKNKVTVVFDGTTDVIDYPQGSSSVNVVFSHSVTADDHIVRLVERSSNPKIVIVVSDDRELQQRARLLDARILSVADFFERSKRDEAKRTKPFLTGKDLCEIEDELLDLFG